MVCPERKITPKKFFHDFFIFRDFVSVIFYDFSEGARDLNQ